jgi:hypothetical protein
MQDAKQITSKFLSLQWRDVLKGFLIAALTPVFTIITTSINQGTLTFNWKAIGLTAISAGLAYLAKNFFEPTQTVIVVKPPLDSESGEKDVKVVTK